ncbi:MAG: HpcH/HpaI aldolase family protein [Sphingomonadaceae bacterium]
MATFRQRLARGETLVGPFISIDSPDLVELIGHAGWDFALIDCEHAPFGNESVADLARACKASGLHTVVRVPANEDWLINKALDVGAEAVVVPQIDSLESARKAADAAKYAPRGHRGANPFTRAGDYHGRGGLDYYRRANEETMLILMVEGAGGAAAIDEIVGLENVDAVFFGPVDLSHSLGLPGQIDHPRVIAKIREMLALARGQGKVAGLFANDVERARFWMGEGAQFVAFGVDANIIFHAFSDLLARLKVPATGRKAEGNEEEA